MIWKKSAMIENIVCLNLPYCSHYMLHKIKKKENKVGQKGSKSKKVNAFIFYIFTHFLSNLEILKFIGQVKITNLIFHPFYVLPTKLPNNTFSKKNNIYQTIKFIGQVKITNLIFHPFHVLPTKLPNNTFLKKKTFTKQ